MAINSVNTILVTMQHRRGQDNMLDPDQLASGEFAVSTDKKYVYMCFLPGDVRRMATYEAFEEDMKIIQQILKGCQNIQTAVEAFEALAEAHKNQAEVYSKESQSWAVGGTGTRDGEDTDNAKSYSEKAKDEADRAKSEADKAAAIVGGVPVFSEFEDYDELLDFLNGGDENGDS